MRCTLLVSEDKSKTEVGKRNRKIQKKKNANKERKKSQIFLKETRAENNKLKGKVRKLQKT